MESKRGRGQLGMVPHFLSTLIAMLVLFGAAISLTYVDDWCVENHRPAEVCLIIKCISLGIFILEGAALFAITGIKCYQAVLHVMQRRSVAKKRVREPKRQIRKGAEAPTSPAKQSASPEERIQQGFDFKIVPFLVSCGVLLVGTGIAYYGIISVSFGINLGIILSAAVIAVLIADVVDRSTAVGRSYSVLVIGSLFCAVGLVCVTLLPLPSMLKLVLQWYGVILALTISTVLIGESLHQLTSLRRLLGYTVLIACDLSVIVFALNRAT